VLLGLLAQHHSLWFTLNILQTILVLNVLPSNNRAVSSPLSHSQPLLSPQLASSIPTQLNSALFTTQQEHEYKPNSETLPRNWHGMGPDRLTSKEIAYLLNGLG